MTTQDTVHGNITDKLSRLNEIHILLKDLDLTIEEDETQTILEDYIAVVTPVLATDPSQYNTALVGSNIVGKIDKLEHKYRTSYNTTVSKLRGTSYTEKVKLIIKTIKEKLESLDKIRHIHNGHLRKKKRSKEIKSCPECKTQMDLISHLSEYRCPKCCFKKTAYGYVPSEVFLDHTSTTKSTSNYRQEENCEIWLNKIQGIDGKDIPSVLIQQLEDLAIREKAILPHKKTCRRIRLWLKELEETKYNNHAAKIKYMMTGIPPEQLTMEEKETTKRYFPPIMEAYNKKKPSNRKNSCYQPHIILKILEQIIDRSSTEKEHRFLRIISNIHFQDDETILKNDRILKDIFKDVGLKFETTRIDYYSSCLE